MKKHKIAFLINSLSSGGAERVLTTLVNNLITSYEITIITFHNIAPFYDLHKNVKHIHCLDKYEPSSNFFEAIKNNYLLLRKINDISRENNFELMINFMTTANVLGTCIGKLNCIPVIISERTNPYHQEIPKLWSVLRLISYRFSSILVVQTETIKKFFIGKVNENKLRILPNPISNELTNNRTLVHHSQKKNIILSVGRLTSLKAHAILIRAFALTKYNNWELWIAGDGPEYNNLDNLITELNLSDHVKLLGLVKDIHTLYNTAKIFAFSSTYEGFPNALIEAMHFGLACVSTDCPTGPGELIKDGENGYLVPINNPDQMSNKLNSLMLNPSKIESFGEKSIITVQQFEEENVIGQWKYIINSLLKS
ncbi:GalNAc-alpha-(1-_4)-GalNAc-alpha-(1-_3)-diNAcBac-PP-undecaprenol alpha-1,4-N-acetyl-D-galactosaminyltransferase [Arenibacter antarcticus]|uniref:Glycosyltransferase family 4 protein n=1 Tax=Arenibacter antarcticus TaxID=2040469 RepID=A0ABW5VJA1_9FLAO|nr:glycosyltransferase family 4 protein [Arenibacter sp. H213]MCM4167341.1 hypothetical protein [Arenibacter sp. H213]